MIGRGRERRGSQVSQERSDLALLTSLYNFAFPRHALRDDTSPSTCHGRMLWPSGILPPPATGRACACNSGRLHSLQPTRLVVDHDRPPQICCHSREL